MTKITNNCGNNDIHIDMKETITNEFHMILTIIRLIYRAILFLINDMNVRYYVNVSY
jgi:hypothetical protein